MQPHYKNKNIRGLTSDTSFLSAFSLVELSIVLVILGLLVGGILGGQSLIRAAELRAVNTEFNRYLTAMFSFRDRYLATPGDMSNATSFWGAPGGNIANCPATAGTGTETCNGDGNGVINVTAPAASQYGENVMFWQHMANAGLIEGNYNGRAGTLGVYHSVPGTNAPISKISNATWATRTLFVPNNDLGRFAGTYPQHLQFGIPSTTSGWPDLPIFKAEELWGIDKKIDDGKPGTGKVIATQPCSTAANATDYAAAYKLNSGVISCVGNFLLEGQLSY